MIAQRRTFVFVTLLVLLQNLPGSSAAIYNCENDAIKRIDISSEAGQEEKIVPMIDAPSFPADGIRCRWEISAHEKDNALIILSSFDANKPTPRRTIRSASRDPDLLSSINYQLVANRGSEGELDECSTSHIEDTVKDNTFRVVQLRKNDYLSVTYQQPDSRAGNRKLPLLGLKVILVEQKFCAREMASFDRRCFTASSFERSLIDELGMLNGDSNIMRLASFQSMEKIKGFVEASKQRVAIIGEAMAMRSKVPLDLTEPLRIGLFYDPQNGGSLKFLDVQQGSCSLKPVEDAELLNSIRPPVNSHERACGSLRVTETGKISIEFNDCKQKLRALISFDEAPQLERCRNCTRPVVQWLHSSGSAADADDTLPRTISQNFIIMVACIVTAAVLILVAVSVMIFCLRRRPRQHLSKTADLVAAEGAEFLDAEGGSKSHDCCQHDDLLGDPEAAIKGPSYKDGLPIPSFPRVDDKSIFDNSNRLA